MTSQPLSLTWQMLTLSTTNFSSQLAHQIAFFSVAALRTMMTYVRTSAVFGREREQEQERKGEREWGREVEGESTRASMHWVNTWMDKRMNNHWPSQPFITHVGLGWPLHCLLYSEDVKFLSIPSCLLSASVEEWASSKANRWTLLFISSVELTIQPFDLGGRKLTLSFFW